jgi:hypothetical protein
LQKTIPRFVLRIAGSAGVADEAGNGVGLIETAGVGAGVGVGACVWCGTPTAKSERTIGAFAEPPLQITSAKEVVTTDNNTPQKRTPNFHRITA